MLWNACVLQAKSGIEVRVVAVGTGQAIRLAERGDADVLLVHARGREDAVVAAGHGLIRYGRVVDEGERIAVDDDPVLYLTKRLPASRAV